MNELNVGMYVINEKYLKFKDEFVFKVKVKKIWFLYVNVNSGFLGKEKKRKGIYLYI